MAPCSPRPLLEPGPCQSPTAKSQGKLDRTKSLQPWGGPHFTRAHHVASTLSARTHPQPQAGSNGSSQLLHSTGAVGGSQGQGLANLREELAGGGVYAPTTTSHSQRCTTGCGPPDTTLQPTHTCKCVWDTRAHDREASMSTRGRGRSGRGDYLTAATPNKQSPEKKAGGGSQPTPSSSHCNTHHEHYTSLRDKATGRWRAAGSGACGKG